MREAFNNNLPHSATLRKWYANSDLNCKEGITGPSLQFLKRKADEMKDKGSKLFCAVCFDEMSIRKQILWDHNQKRMYGYVSYGNENDDDPLIAREAIVFMASGLNEKFRIPIAHHFVNSLDAVKKSDLVKSVLLTIMATGIEVTSVTFDGHPTNKKLCKILGANLNVFDNVFQPYFMLDGKKIHIFLDVCHNEKLVRGWLDKKHVLFDLDGKKIKWEFLQHLVKFSQQRGFSLTHKLNQSHLNWRRRPMNVRIAVETLSSSTADSIEFLKNDGHKEFEDSTATVRFIRLFDNLFDIFNTKSVSVNENLFKCALNPENKEDIFTLLNESVEYIKKLSFKDEAGEVKNLCLSSARTGFIGFIINISSLKSIYESYVERSHDLKLIPTYYLNQDAVEMFFGKIR